MLSVGGSMRSYVLHVPAKYDASKPAPLVVDFHPLGGSGPSERSGSPYPAVTDPDGVIAAFPSGLSGPSGGAWNVGPCCVKDVDDVAFAKALVEDVKKVACVDRARVYAVGFSMGGGMSHYLACKASNVFAAVAPAAFDLLKENIDECKPTRPITVVAFRGTTDPIVPYAGGNSAVVQGMPITFLGAKTTFDKWSEINKCSDTASAEDANGCIQHKTCDGGVEVLLCSKQGGGHEAGNAKLAWPILKQHVLP
jgi:polyhydroxybutyrate depolymerase